MKQKTFALKFSVILAALLLFSVLLCGQRSLPASAAEAAEELVYSTALQDLSKDEDFDQNNYPSDPTDHAVYVIQIAESKEGELFVYTYQPAQKTLYLVASKLNLSRTESAADTKLYDLTLLNCESVFGKYRVEGLTVSADEVRYYNISTIYRDYDKIADGEDGDVSGIGFRVGQVWTAETVDGEVTYTNQSTGTITITDCAYGSIRIPQGFNWWLASYKDLHFIAFSTDIEIDHLLEATVSYEYRTMKDGIYNNDEKGGEWISTQVTVTYKDQGATDPHIFGKQPTRVWDRIQTAEAFLNSLDENGATTSEEVRTDLLKNEWVLAFAETEYTDNAGGVFGWLSYIASVFGYKQVTYTEVSKATVLRLMFIKDNQKYDLGAVAKVSAQFGQVGEVGGGNSNFGAALNEFGDKLVHFFQDVATSPIRLLAKFLNIPEWAVWTILGVIALIAIAVVIAVFVTKNKVAALAASSANKGTASRPKTAKKSSSTTAKAAAPKKSSSSPKATAPKKSPGTAKAAAPKKSSSTAKTAAPKKSPGTTKS